MAAEILDSRTDVPVRVAIVGVGSWAATLANAISSIEDLQLVSCFARTPEARQQFADTHDCRAMGSYEEVLDDPEVEAVLIVTSHSSHRALVELAAAADKHIFVEKPLTLTLEEARATVSAVAEAGVVLQVGHQRRRTAGLRRARALIDEGRMGQIQLLEANFSSPMAFTMGTGVWRRDPDQAPLGAMTSLGIHHIDTLLYLAGSIDSVFAMSRPGRDGSRVDESTVLLARFSNGALGTIATSMYVLRLSRLTIQGSEGAIFVEDDGTALGFQEVGLGRQAIALDGVDPVVDQLEEFAAAVRGLTVPEVSGAQGLAVVAVMDAAVESVRSGIPQTVPI